MNAPPWTHTTTGHPVAWAGAYTFTDKQSSLIAVLSPTPLISDSRPWTATAPERLASRSPDHGVGGCGGRKRSAPTGASAYGIPFQTRTPSRSTPRTVPLVVWIARRMPAV